MSKRLIEFDPETGVSTYSDYNELEDSLTITKSQDVEVFLDHSKSLQNDEDYTRKGIKGEMWHYAMIPNIIIEKWLLEDGFDIFDKNNEKALFRRLNSPEYKY
ncbi:MAG TPA: hypothetical protein VIY48_17000, partial [Candidatus Paceibacterota bacterium]